MGLNDNQRKCATTFGVPIAVIAGAGSGKTSTLKERIANAFDESIAGPSTVTDINQVLAITFTDKAALELKSRIKSTLRSRNMPQQAMLVDDAWISTIHAMCSRIIRENALALGIDPAFTVLSDDDRSQLLDAAIEEALLDEACADDIAALFEEYRRETVKAMVEELIDKAVQSSRLFDSIVGPDDAWHDASLDSFMEVAAKYYKSRGEQATLLNMAGLLEGSGPEGKVMLASGEHLSWDLRDRDENGNPIDADGLLDRRLLDLRLSYAQRYWNPLMNTAKNAYRRFREAKITSGVFDNNDLLLEASAALAREDIRQLYADRFKVVMIDEFQDTDEMQLGIIKSFCGSHGERLCVVGDPQQSIYRFRGADLSVCSAHVNAVKQVEGEVIPLDDNYRSDAAILDFVDLVFGDDCSDMDEASQEQEEARASEDSMAPDEAAAQAARPQPAPSYYQKLKASRDESRIDEAHRFEPSLEGPRVVVQEIQHLYQKEGIVWRFEAEQVARRFKELHDGPKMRSYGDMVVLLGAMTHAADYAAAFDEAGIPCAITGGSVLSGKPDALLMASLANVLANPLDANALCPLLASDIFGFDQSDFIALVHDGTAMVPAADDVKGTHETRDIGKAFAALLGRAAATQNREAAPSSRRLDFAVQVLARAYDCARQGSVAKAMEGVLLDSGWLSRMQSMDAAASGTAEAPADLPADSDGGQDAAAGVTGRSRAADALKVIRMARALEAEGYCGARSIAQHLEVRLAMAKEAPGVLSARNNAFVRIMTIHASKGLQFPIVAVGALGGGGGSFGSSSRLAMQTSRGTTYASLDCQDSIADAEGAIGGCTKKKNREAIAADAIGLVGGGIVTDEALAAIAAAAKERGSLAYLYSAIGAFGDEQDAEELERKLYVAFTRAEEALIVTLHSQVSFAAEGNKMLDDLGYGVSALSRIAKSKKATDEEKAESSQEIKRLQSHVSLPDLTGKLDGVAGRIHERRAIFEQRGGDFRLATIAWVAKWAADGTLPPAWHGEKGGPEDANGVLLAWDNPISQSLDGHDSQAFKLPASFPDNQPISLRYAPQWAAGLLSASALKKEGSGNVEYLPEDVPDAPFDEDPVDAPAPAPEKGTAFHALGQWAALRWQTTHELSMPPKARIDAIARLHGLSAEQRDSLCSELSCWLESPAASQMASKKHLQPEAPFFVRLAMPGQGRSALTLNGFIDLLAFDDPAGDAFVVDYKTGRTHDADAKRREAYEVQAKCYAYAVLLQGFQSVRLSFVFVDQPDAATGQPCIAQFPAPGEKPYRLEALEEELGELACSV